MTSMLLYLPYLKVDYRLTGIQVYFQKYFQTVFFAELKKKIMDREKLSFSKYVFGVKVLIIEIFSKGNGRTIRKFLSTIFNKFRIGC